MELRQAQRRVVEVDRRIIAGTPARVETLRRRAQGDGVINTAYIERLHATFRSTWRLAPRVAGYRSTMRAAAAAGPLLALHPLATK